MNRNIFFKAMAIVIFSLCLVFSGCSDSDSPGGNDDGPTPPPAGAMAGVFVDAPVEGLWYETATMEGYTDSRGTFFYKSGENVSFYLGDILLGQVAGAEKISPFDLVGMEPPVTSAEIMTARNRMMESYYASPLEVVINMAVLLQSLDDDGDDSNGIAIPEEIHTLINGLDLNFAQYPEDFAADYQLNELMARGRDAGLWGGARALRDSFYALDSLYAGLGIKPDIYAYASYYYSLDGDPSSWEAKDTAQYDAFGNQSQVLYDKDFNGKDSVIEAVYDANGYLVNYTETALQIELNVVFNTYVWDYVDSISQVQRNFYDDNGYLIEMQLNALEEHYREWTAYRSFHIQTGPSVDINDVTYYDRDRNGNITEATNFIVGVDEFNVRTETLVDIKTSTYEYNDIGVPTLQVTNIDPDGDDVPDYMEIVERDDSGNMLSYSYYDLSDNPDPISDPDNYVNQDLYTYDDGLLVEHTFDGPGVVPTGFPSQYVNEPDYVETYSYDDGLLVGYEWEGMPVWSRYYSGGWQYVSSDNSGNIIEVYDYDSNGLMISLVQYDANDDPPSMNYFETYEYNSMYSLTETYNSSGDLTVTYVYDADGLLRSTSYDEGSDGSIEEYIEGTYIPANGFKSIQFLP